eukprot:scaffold25028_cov19-Tisochrysis_lutea.AAC.1
MKRAVWDGYKHVRTGLIQCESIFICTIKLKRLSPVRCTASLQPEGKAKLLPQPHQHSQTVPSLSSQQIRRPEWIRGGARGFDSRSAEGQACVTLPMRLLQAGWDGYLW